MRPLSRLGNAILDLVYPRLCLLCGEFCESNSYFCDPHLRGVRVLPNRNCLRCGHPLPVIFPGRRCSFCRGTTLYFARARSAFFYAASIRETIALWKFQKKREAIYPMADGLVAVLRAQDWIEKVDFVSFVPLHRQKRKERGFNQAEDLANDVGMQLCLPVRATLRRCRPTVAQGSTQNLSRHENVAGAFGMAPRTSVESTTILLLDDVYTSGATVSECSRILRVAGAKKVYVATIARGGVSIDFSLPSKHLKPEDLSLNLKQERNS